MTATADIYPTFLLALCAWREARGEIADAWRGVVHVVLNRAASPRWWGKDIVSVILHPFQFSSFNRSDPNSSKFPASGDVEFEGMVLYAVEPGDDPTGGATSYYSVDIEPPSWVAEMTFTVEIGNIRFYKV